MRVPVVSVIAVESLLAPMLAPRLAPMLATGTRPGHSQVGNRYITVHDGNRVVVLIEWAET